MCSVLGTATSLGTRNRVVGPKPVWRDSWILSRARVPWITFPLMIFAKVLLPPKRAHSTRKSVSCDTAGGIHRVSQLKPRGTSSSSTSVSEFLPSRQQHQKRVMLTTMIPYLHRSRMKKTKTKTKTRRRRKEGGVRRILGKRLKPQRRGRITTVPRRIRMKTAKRKKRIENEG